MQKTLFLTILTVISLTSPIYAEDNQSKKDGLENKIYGCMEDSECPIALKLQLLDELQNEMSSRLHRISLACAKKNYELCIDKNQPDVKEWHRANDRMGELMSSLEGFTPMIARKNKAPE